MTFDGSQIPQALRNLNQWLCWQKPKKIPLNPHNGTPTNAPAAVWSYEKCITAAAGQIIKFYAPFFILLSKNVIQICEWRG